MANAASTRPELACEIVPEGVIAARRQPGSGLLASAAFAAWGPNAPTAAVAAYVDKDAPRVGMPGIGTGDPLQRAAVVETIRRALESVGGRNGVLTLVIPDQAVRVLIMDFDALPGKAADAIPLLKFRLKKMLPFDVEDAAVSYQALPAKTGARALVAVIPNAILREYEGMVREAGFEPGVVLPSTLACLGMIAEGDTALVVHASTQCVTTAIAGGQELKLHRSQELPWTQEQLVQTMDPGATTSTYKKEEMPMPVVEGADVTHVDSFGDMERVMYPMVFPDEPARQEDDEPQMAWGDPWEGEVASETEEPAQEQPEVPREQPAVLEVQPEAAAPGPVQSELHDALVVAAAYYEDAVGKTPSPILVAGSMDAKTWHMIVNDEALQLRDLITLEDLGTAIDSGLSRAQLGAVCGALRG